jgi:type I restriction enzyme S subunit
VKWSRVKLESIKSTDRYSLVGGPFGSELTGKDYVDEGVPVIRGANLPQDHVFHDDDFVFVREEKANELVANLAYPGDLVFTQRGTLGQVGIIPPDARYSCYVVSQSQMKLTVDPDKADARFIYYYFRHAETIQTIKNHALSSGVPHINLGILREFEVPLPPLQIQKDIAHILSIYDDLIENNRRRIELLGDATRLLYQEWFVRFRYPGHEQIRIVDGLPTGWKRQSLSRLTTKIGSGATPRGGEASYLSAGIPLIRSLNVYDDRFADDGLAFIGDDQAALLANVTVESRDVLLNITGASVARCCMAPERYVPARVNQHVMIIRVDPCKANPFFVHACINSDERKRQLLSYAQKGSTREALTKDMMAAFEITIPSGPLMEQFGEFAAISFLQRENLALQNQKLKSARDLLLPRLMSGALTA